MVSDFLANIQFRLGAEVDPAGRALSDTSWSGQLHGSENLWMLFEGAHVLTLMLFAGTIFMVDLRLLGVAFRDTPVSKVTDKLLPYTVIGFGLMVATGLLLFFANPLEYYHSFWFRLKFGFVLLAAANIFFFHFRVQADRSAWDQRARPPLGARASAALSLILWTAIIVAGRFAAYDWLDCERATGFVAAVSQCSAHNAALERIEAEIL
jgi:hypothetical protein